MIVLADIELMNFLRPLNLLKDEEILISELFLSDFYLTSVQRQAIVNLKDEKKVNIFETDLGFCALTREVGISLPEASSIYYAQKMKVPLLSQNNLIIDICQDLNIEVQSALEALRFLQVADNKIDFIEKVLNLKQEMEK